MTQSVSNTIQCSQPIGRLALEFYNLQLPLQIRGGAGEFYIGTADEYTLVTEESVERFETQLAALTALREGRWTQRQIGLLAWRDLRCEMPLRVMYSGSGYYIGTWDNAGPVSRESVEYFPIQGAAEEALKKGMWTQRLSA